MASFKKIIFIVLFYFFLFTPNFVKAINDDSSIEAIIIKVIEEKEIETMGTKQLYQKLELYFIHFRNGLVGLVCMKDLLI